MFGSSPASLKSSLFQYRTMVERWNGMPQVLPPVWLFSMKAGKKLVSHALSSAVLTTSSKGTIASSSISVNMSVESSIAVWRRLAALVRGERLDDRLLVGARVDRLHLDAGVLLLEIGGEAVDDLGDRPADRHRVVEGDLGALRAGRADAEDQADRQDEDGAADDGRESHGNSPGHVDTQRMPVVASNRCVASGFHASVTGAPAGSSTRPGARTASVCFADRAGDDRVGAEILHRGDARGEPGPVRERHVLRPHAEEQPLALARRHGRALGAPHDRAAAASSSRGCSSAACR